MTQRELDSKALEAAMNAYEAQFPDVMGITYDGLKAGLTAYLSALPAPATQEVDELRDALKPFAALADDYLGDTVNFDDDTIMAGRMTQRGEEGTPPRVTFSDFRRAALALAQPPTAAPQLREDTARLDWLEMQMVKVMTPGARTGTVWAVPPGDFGGDLSPSDLRAQIDRARAAEKDRP